MSNRAGSFAAYGILGLPLAMAALPVYILVPVYYTTQLGLSLSLVGLVLFAARAVDTIQDPWIGQWINHLARRARLGRVLWLACAILIITFAGLWLTTLSGPALAAWMALSLIIIYTAHSVLNIAYLAWGARLATDTATLTRAAGWREAFGLAGVILASTLPAWLVNTAGTTPRQGMAVYSALFALLLAVSLAALLRSAPGWVQTPESSDETPWRTCFSNQHARCLLLPYFLNALSVSVPATLVLFYIADVINAPQWSGYFLGVYFLTGAAGIPFWTKLSARLGPLRAWRLGMILAVAAFVWAATLGPGDHYLYLLICVLAGLSLGADLILPPVLLARLIPGHEAPATYYGIWSLLGKLALALSGLALPWLASVDYRPGTPGGGVHILAWTYGGLPCLLKLVALWRLQNFHVLNQEDAK